MPATKGAKVRTIAEEVANGVVDHVAQHGSDDQQGRQGMNIQHTAHCEGTGSKQQ